MAHLDPSKFQHATLTRKPTNVIGVTLLDERPGFTGIYLRDDEGKLWPVRTVTHVPAIHHDRVCQKWLATEGIHEDRRTNALILDDKTTAKT